MLKNYHLFVLLFGILLPACHTAQTALSPAPPLPQATAQPLFVQWDKKFVELGSVKKGEKRSLYYEFTNTFQENIQIDIVDACDCTKVEFPRGAIEPGQKGRLDVVFDSTEKDASETISINVIFKNTHPDGAPYIETVTYAFELVK